MRTAENAFRAWPRPVRRGLGVPAVGIFCRLCEADLVEAVLDADFPLTDEPVSAYIDRRGTE